MIVILVKSNTILKPIYEKHRSESIRLYYYCGTNLPHKSIDIRIGLFVVGNNNFMGTNREQYSNDTRNICLNDDTKYLKIPL